MVAATHDVKSSSSSMRALAVLLSLGLLMMGLSAGTQIHSKFIVTTSSIRSATSSELEIGRKESDLLEKDKNTSAGKARPRAIIHVGPCKTGTTALQTSLEVLGPELEKDNFVAMNNTWIHNFVKACLKHSNAYQGCSTSPERQQLVEILNKGQNVILSREQLANQAFANPHHLRAALEGFDVQVLMVYRRFFEWLVSRHGQTYRSNWDKWDTKTSAKTPSVYEYLTPALIEEKKQASYPTIRIPAFQEARLEVQLFNYHQHDNIVTGILCSDAVNAPHTCLAAQQVGNDNKSIRANRAQSTGYDEIVVAAHQQGLIDASTISRPRARTALAKVLKVKEANLPKKCLDVATQQILLEESLRAEATLFPYYHESEALADLFEQYKTTKFCGVDVSAVLMWENVTEFLG